MYTYGARVLYPCTFTTIRNAIDPNTHLQILCPSLHQIFCKAIDLNVHFQILELFLYVGMNQFGDSSSALFTKNKTCLNVFVGPGDGGLYPQLNSQDVRDRYMSLHRYMSQHRWSWGRWKYQLYQGYAIMHPILV